MNTFERTEEFDDWLAGLKDKVGKYKYDDQKDGQPFYPRALIGKTVAANGALLAFAVNLHGARGAFLFLHSIFLSWRFYLAGLPTPTSSRSIRY